MGNARCTYRVDLAQLRENFNFLKRCAGDCHVMPVLKYNAYGMGFRQIGTALKEAGAFRFAAATLDEALELKTLGLDVQILGLLPVWEIAPAVAADIICSADNLQTAELISAEAVRQNKSVRLAVKIDTGMGRLGFPADEAAEMVKKIVKLPGLIPDSLFSHFATAAQPDMVFASLQLKRFLEVKETLDAAGIVFDYYHHAAGDATEKIPESVQKPFNLVRPGGRLYGINFSDNCRQVVEFAAHVGEIRALKAGDSVGYNRIFIADKPLKAAVLTAGYADGIPLALSNKGRVIIRGEYCRILGRISMDYTVVDVSNVPDVSIGDEAVLLGKRGECAVTVQEWSRIKETHGHDIWCAIGHRAKREYIG